MLLISSETKGTLILQILPRENWFQYVYAEYTQLQLISLHYNLTPTYKRYEVNHL